MYVKYANSYMYKCSSPNLFILIFMLTFHLKIIIIIILLQRNCKKLHLSLVFLVLTLRFEV